MSFLELKVVATTIAVCIRIVTVYANFKAAGLG